MKLFISVTTVKKVDHLPRFVCFHRFQLCLYPMAKIGNYTMLAPEVKIIGGDHKFNIPGLPIIFQVDHQLETNIVRDVWIDARSIIMRGYRRWCYCRS